MKPIIILASVLLLSLFAACRAEESEVVRKREKRNQLKVHNAATETAAYKSDGVETTGFKPNDVLAFHAERVSAFIGTDGAGISRRMVPRTLMHQLVREESEGPKAYAATFQELIGIAMHPTPGAYKANFITQTVSGMDEAKANKVPLRKLDEFEIAALEKLKTGRDLVTEELPGKLRVVGAIRASGDCMACHNCKERDLLGAFTYVLTPAPDLRATLRNLAQEETETQSAKPVAPPKAVVQQANQF